MQILQLNSVVNSGSTGRITEEIGEVLLKNGHESYIAYGRGSRLSKSKLIKIGKNKDVLLHVLKTRLTDKHGFGSKNATIEFIKIIEQLKPDAIGLHNLHGYYINIEILFNYLKEFNKPVIWTLHDCWAFTGHCSHFERINCFKWQTHCEKCPLIHFYPSSFLIDNSRQNFINKKKLFTGIKNLHIVTPSHWLSEHVKKSFLSEYPISVIHNGIDLNTFRPINTELVIKKYELEEKKIILGVTNIWAKRKGLEDFIKLSQMLGSSFQIVLVGLKQSQIKKLPANVIGISRTENVNELAELYSTADVFVNPTYVDNFPTTNIEALACGTPVITYNTGGSPEAIDSETGMVVEKGNVNAVADAIKQITNNGREFYSAKCRARAEKMFDKNDRYGDYLSLYERILQGE